MPKENIVQKIAKKMGGNLGGRNIRGFVWDPLIISIFLFTMFIAIPPLMNLGQVVTGEVASNCMNCNATQIANINHTGTDFFLNTPGIVLTVIYFVLILSAFISASYEGANPAVTLLLGIFFIVIGMVVSFPISDVAHAYISQAIFTNTAAHLSIVVYIMNRLPYFNALLTIIYIVLVVMRREVIVQGLGFGEGGGGNVINT